MQDVIVFVGYGLALLCLTRRNMISEANAVVWYSASMALISTFSAPVVCQQGFFTLVSPAVMVLVVSLSLAFMHTTVVVMWIVPFVAVLCWSDWSVYSGSASEASFAVNTKLLFGIFTCVVTGLVESSYKLQLRAQTEARLLLGKESALVGLMKIFYDIVVELDADFSITSASEDSAAVMCCGASSKLIGQDFRDYLQDADDKQHFAELLSQPPGEQTPRA